MTAYQVIEPNTEAAQSEPIPTFNARDLTVGGNLASIVLDGQTYTLRITRQKKLILTK